jgi:hypothetical protein
VENRSTCGDRAAMICLMFRHAFLLAASAVADAPKAAVALPKAAGALVPAAVDGARS